MVNCGASYQFGPAARSVSVEVTDLRASARVRTLFERYMISAVGARSNAKILIIRKPGGDGTTQPLGGVKKHRVERWYVSHARSGDGPDNTTMLVRVLDGRGEANGRRQLPHIR